MCGEDLHERRAQPRRNFQGFFQGHRCLRARRRLGPATAASRGRRSTPCEEGACLRGRGSEVRDLRVEVLDSLNDLRAGPRVSLGEEHVEAVRMRDGLSLGRERRVEGRGRLRARAAEVASFAGLAFAFALFLALSFTFPLAVALIEHPIPLPLHVVQLPPDGIDLSLMRLCLPLGVHPPILLPLPIGQETIPLALQHLDLFVPRPQKLLHLPQRTLQLLAHLGRLHALRWRRVVSRHTRGRYRQRM